MKKTVTMLLILCLIVALSSVCAPTADAGTAYAKSGLADPGPREARFLNMLNHNFVYGEAFDDTDEMVNDSVLALLSVRDAADEEYIAETYVCDYVKNMYGIEIVDFSLLNEQYPRKEGFVYIIPRGFSVYHHEMMESRENEDGTFTVVTQVTVTPHDAKPQQYKAISLFVKNDDSGFGYNLISSDIITNSIDL